jgi:methyltransferase OMS1
VEDSGLEVVNIKRYNFGTTWWLELKPRKGLRKKIAETATAAVKGEQPLVPQTESLVTQKPWWSLWR